jgi:glycosyltransferase involved in cell wall biosynthesis
MPDHEFRMIGGPGDGERELYDSIKVRADATKNVRFLGFLPFERTEEQFDQASVFVNTSESEGFPNTFLQAWSRGVPSVSFVDAGARLDRNPVGLLVRSFDEMLAAVRSVAADDAFRVREGQRCAAYVERNHSPDRIVELYERVFAEMAPSRPASADGGGTKP